MDDKRHKPRRRDRSRGGSRGGGRPRPGGRADQPQRRADGRERDGNVVPKDDDMRLGKCSNCGGPAPDKANLCRHCTGMPKSSKPADAEDTE